MAAAALMLTPTFSAVADVSGQYKTVALFDSDARLSVLAAMGGVRAAARIGALTEFGQLLVGVVRASGSAFGSTTSGRSLSIQPGVGRRLSAGDGVVARAELDLRLIAAQPEPSMPDTSIDSSRALSTDIGAVR